MSRIEIPLGKKKISLLLFGAVIFVVLGINFIIAPETFVNSIIRTPHVIRIAGIVSILFFGAVGLYGLRRLFDKTIGLIVDENGITDHTNASSIGLIEWKDILEIRTEKVVSTKFLLIYVKNPEKYLERAKGFKRKLMEGNSSMYGTPLSIISNTLRTNFDELEKLIETRLIEYQEKMSSR